LLVALFHFEAQWHFFSWPFLRNSFLFVDYFFVLSGFVISHAYLNKIEKPGGLRLFVISRFGRIWPLHVCLLGFLIFMELSKHTIFGIFGYQPESSFLSSNNDLYSIMTNIFMIHSFGLHETLTWNYPSWSIGAEFYTYLFFGVLAFFYSKRLIVLSLLIIVFGFSILDIYSNRYMDATFELGIFRCLYGFFTGHLIYRFFNAYKHLNHLDYKISSALEIACIFLVFLFVYNTGNTPSSMFSPMVFAVSVYVFAFERGAFSKFLTTRFFVNLGAWSYSIYMVHAVIFLNLKGFALLVEKIFKIHLFAGDKLFYGNEYYMDVLAFIYICLVIAVASVTYRLIELPSIAYFKRIGRQKLIP